MLCPHVSATSLSPPAANAQVHKDDCTQCFDSPDDSWGLDVCLSCFNGGCNSPDRRHSKFHHEISGHPLVVNIKRRRRPRTDRHESPVKIAKLTIEPENEEEKYFTSTLVRCLACDGQEIPRSESNLDEVVKGIVSAVSSSRKSEVKAWEQEMVPCEHTLYLEQGPSKKLESQSLAHCSRCDLKENLWLCLNCGDLGCGRQQFGGVGGNGHALTHYETSKHPVAVKLGSITPDGDADIYCYACNDEKTDPELAKHLAHWGINIAERQKTEKSLTELQIEHNMKWEFSMSANGKELEPLMGPELTGLKNLGNTCYMNSVLQCLFSLEDFKKRYYETGRMPACIDPADDLETQVRKVADGLISGRYSKPDPEGEEAHKSDNEPVYQKGIAPFMFKALIGKGHEEFSTMRQQDAFEFYQHFVKIITRANKQAHQHDPTKSFTFEMEQRLECLHCHRVKYTTIEQDHLQIPVPARRLNTSGDTDKVAYEQVTLNECLEIYCSNEHLDYKCKSCGSDSAGASKQVLFKTFPKNLVINAQRFEIVNWVPTKLDIPVTTPGEALDLSPFLSKGRQDDEEELNDEEVVEVQFTPNAEAALLLEGMGFMPNQIARALYNTGNTDAEAATNWLFSHLDDSNINDPLELASGAKVNTSSSFDQEQVGVLEAMGFSTVKAKRALQETENNTERAVEWLFSHPDEGDSSEIPAAMEEQDERLDSSNLPADYKLASIICHKGASIHAGHYVAFIKKPLLSGDVEWVLFNDEKVVKGGDVAEMKEFAYMYVFSHN